MTTKLWKFVGINVLVMTAISAYAGNEKWKLAYENKASWAETMATDWLNDIERVPKNMLKAYLRTRPNPDQAWTAYQQRLFRDFPSTIDQQMMMIERLDRVWRDFFSSRHGYPALAKAYASRCDERDRQVALKLAETATTWDGLLKVRRLYYRHKTMRHIALAEKTLAYVKQSGAPVSFDEELAKFKVIASTTTTGWVSRFKEISALRRKILFSHPALDFDELLINKHSPGTYSHNCDQYLARHSRPGPGLAFSARPSPRTASGAPRRTGQARAAPH